MTGRSFGLAPLSAKTEVARNTYVLDYEFSFESGLAPGQFAMVHPGTDHQFVLPRPLSILDASEGHLRLLVKIAGRGSRALVEAPIGSTARIFAPLGNGFDLDALRSETLVLVAGGVGVVPLHLASRRLVEAGCPPLRCLFGARTPEDLPVGLWEDGTAGRWDLWVEEGARDSLREGRVTDGLLEILGASPGVVVLTCGPTPMMQAVSRIAQDAGSPVWLCLEEQMGCGAGVCRACVVEPRSGGESAKWTVCREGPVFRLDEIHYLRDRPPAATGGQASP